MPVGQPITMWTILPKEIFIRDDTVIVYKAGDIIPAVLCVVKDKRVSDQALAIPTSLSAARVSWSS